MVLDIILSQDKYSRLRSVIGRATPRRVTGIFRDFFLLDGEKGEREKDKKEGRERVWDERGEKRGG